MPLDLHWFSRVRDEVLKRDGRCVSCKSEDGLKISCVRKFDRTKADSWITLCEPCRKRKNEGQRKTVVKGQDSCKRIMLRRIEEQDAELRELRAEIWRLKHGR